MSGGAPIDTCRVWKRTDGLQSWLAHPRRPPGPSCMGWLRRSDQVCAHCPFSKAWNRGLLGGVAVPSDPLQQLAVVLDQTFQPDRLRTAAGRVVGKVRHANLL